MGGPWCCSIFVQLASSIWSLHLSASKVFISNRFGFLFCPTISLDRLFEENSELLALFTKFQSLKTKDAQRESMELAEHAAKVMATIDESISSLDKVDFFIDYLHLVGRDHCKIPGFRKEYFWVRISE